MKRLAKTVLLLLSFCSFFLTASADQGGFIYKDVKVDAIVHKDNSLEVTETFVIDYSEPRHGYYRYLPEEFVLWRNMAAPGEKENNQLLHFYPDIDDIEVEGGDADISSDSGNKVIRIGSEYTTVTGVNTYIIKYKYSYPDDRTEDYDYLYHTILGIGFSELIEHLSFNLTFEKPLPKGATDGLEVYSGTFGSTDNADNVELTVQGNTIKGEAVDIQPNHSVTLSMLLPEGYYEGVWKVKDTAMWICLGISALLILIILYCELTVKRPIITRSIEFYPPEGVSSAEVGTIIDDSADGKDVFSLIPWFASKGYLSIAEEEEKQVLGKDKTVLQLKKLKPLPDDAPEYQKTFFDTIFSGSDTEVSMTKLQRKGEEIEKAQKQLGDSFSKEKELTTLKDSGLLIFPLIISSTLAMQFSNRYAYFDWGIMMGVGLLWLLPFVLGYIMRVSSAAGDIMHSTGHKMLYFILKLITMLIILGVCYAYMTGADYFMPAWAMVALFGSCFLVTELSGRLLVDTPYRVEMMGKLLGLREFIDTAEKPRLESLIADDPDYFYRIFPYAMVFNLSDKWADNFKEIPTEQPSWYASNTMLSTHSFAKSFASTIETTSASTLTAAMNASSGSGSSSGGGGFSGGGGGGGGGGSW